MALKIEDGDGYERATWAVTVEALAQAGGLLVKFSLTEDTTNKVTYLMAIDNARFRKPVVPGDRVELHVDDRADHLRDAPDVLQ